MLYPSKGEHVGLMLSRLASTAKRVLGKTRYKKAEGKILSTEAEQISPKHSFLGQTTGAKKRH